MKSLFPFIALVLLLFSFSTIFVEGSRHHHQHNHRLSLNGREDEEWEYPRDAGLPLPPRPAGAITDGEVWPLPQKIHYGHQNRTLRRDSVLFQFRGIRDADCDILDSARKKYLKQWLFPSKLRSSSAGAVTVVIRLHKKCPKANEFPQQDMDEEYRLRVPYIGDITIDAQEVWGIIRGLETLSQLIFQVKDTILMRTATIHDWPEYPIRGIMVDSSRHYLHKNMIIRQIDIMAQHKMNLLHWHIVDMESFPYVSKLYPNLHKGGAFTPRHIYTPGVVQEVIQYARLRGVRVMVEIDTPGHMAAWLGQPQLLSQCTSAGEVIPSQLFDPSVEENFIFLERFFKEISDTFPEKLIHLGGDEVSYWIETCWKNNPTIQKFMKSRSIESITALENFYFTRLQTIIKELEANRTMIFWQEVYQNNNPNPGAVIHVWKDMDPLQRASFIGNITASGYKVLVSSGWYLNYIAYGDDWKAHYKADPRNFDGTYEQKKMVLGGIACMWGEYVDGTNLEARMWPRASAVAERLWSSPEDTKDATKAWPRLHEHRCRLIARGFRIEPVNGAGDYCPVEWNDPV